MEPRWILAIATLASQISQVVAVRFYRLPPTFEQYSKEVSRFKASDVWACFASAEDYDAQWTHFFFDKESGNCSLRGGLQSFEIKPASMYTTPAGQPAGNFYVKDANNIVKVDGCPAEYVLRELVCASAEQATDECGGHDKWTTSLADDAQADDAQADDAQADDGEAAGDEAARDEAARDEAARDEAHDQEARVL
ncbi:hypothetical protein AAVH_09962 [Aphelenchoides avenae]|nr:hypothetical protein AAVH_09962 [Aphelenchus avenae]